MVGRWLWPGNRTFLEVASLVVTWWIAAFLCSATLSSDQLNLLGYSRVWVEEINPLGTDRVVVRPPRHILRWKQVAINQRSSYRRCAVYCNGELSSHCCVQFNWSQKNNQNCVVHLAVTSLCMAHYGNGEATGKHLYSEDHKWYSNFSPFWGSNVHFLMQEIT